MSKRPRVAELLDCIHGLPWQFLCRFDRGDFAVDDDARSANAVKLLKRHQLVKDDLRVTRLGTRVLGWSVSRFDN